PHPAPPRRLLSKVAAAAVVTLTVGAFMAPPAFGEEDNRISAWSTGGKHAFSMVPIDDWLEELNEQEEPLWQGWEFVDVIDINDNHDVLCIMKHTQTLRETAFVRIMDENPNAIQDAFWRPVREDLGDTNDYVPLGFNNSRSVVGYYNNGTYDVGYRADYSSGSDPWTIHTYFTTFGGQVSDINNVGDMCGIEQVVGLARAVVYTTGGSWGSLPTDADISDSGALAISERSTRNADVVVAGQGVDVDDGGETVGLLWWPDGSTFIADRFDGTTGPSWSPRPTGVSSSGLVCGFETVVTYLGSLDDQPNVWVPTAPLPGEPGWAQRLLFASGSMIYKDLEYRLEHRATDMYYNDVAGDEWAIIVFDNGGIWVWTGAYGSQDSPFTFVPVHRHVNYPRRALDGLFVGAAVNARETLVGTVLLPDEQDPIGPGLGMGGNENGFVGSDPVGTPMPVVVLTDGEIYGSCNSGSGSE
ncbi:MAG: hypothetical protein ACOC0P_01515, partial [Planctomycetota bacterium]